jgi:hypothetical protein
MIFAVDWIDEQRPAVLQIRRHHHADDAEYQLTPPRRFAGVRGRRHIVSCGHISHTFCLVGKSNVTSPPWPPVVRFAT